MFEEAFPLVSKLKTILVRDFTQVLGTFCGRPYIALARQDKIYCNIWDALGRGKNRTLKSRKKAIRKVLKKVLKEKSSFLGAQKSTQKSALN